MYTVVTLEYFWMLRARDLLRWTASNCAPRSISMLTLVFFCSTHLVLQLACDATFVKTWVPLFSLSLSMCCFVSGFWLKHCYGGLIQTCAMVACLLLIDFNESSQRHEGILIACSSLGSTRGADAHRVDSCVEHGDVR
ncbi:hypothetical protein TOT_030000104 [Theileria orientalis strain Shintoku]|uniref:Uncharacterized protein n=1 Tax=Theileria orientalis strain Shintoku TaxID=869250 RepID=J4CDB3_THEOR|nr:LOW QUALITY PROTEIN: hypothetical protein TOT_030000104 [Theileria orientalis strain Shintoku]BAM40842.1 hypothetical protein TOT_030000104 [Theileria orientalis strain Shintoku]|eukprot:XP_009691143.1 LOW QUALITY PROTEIN: hypothetical protein TOT_030000104 [Theileria orientalis strain Shintoku]